MHAIHDSGPWPPRCCVPAFVHKVLEANGFFTLDRSRLARALGVVVAPTDENPFGLQTDDAARNWGILLCDAEQRINQLLASESTSLAFRHISFNTIMFGLYDEVLQAAIAKKCHVGIGLDSSMVRISTSVGSNGPITNRTRAQELHVVRVLQMRSESVLVIDDSTSADSFWLEWPVLESATRPFDGGYWIIGRPEDLQFPHTLPWRFK